MGEPQRTHAAIVALSIGENIGNQAVNFIDQFNWGANIGDQIDRFEWASFINNGYIVRARIRDPFFNIAKNVITKNYLRDGRSKETPIRFNIRWANGNITKNRVAFIVALNTFGEGTLGELEFVAIDPPSFYLSEGTSDGRTFKGNVSAVIRSVVQLFAPAVSLEITETLDNQENVWGMMRQDPKTFIRSLLEWSSSVTPNKTHWVISSVDNRLIIKEQAALQSFDLGIYHYNRASAGGGIYDYNMLSNNFISPLQTKLTTSGISAISGEYLDKVADTNQRSVVVTDSNTSAKANVDSNPSLSFKKSSKQWSTSVMSVPEHNAGDIGIPYNKYIDGRARGLFLNMLNLGMRLRIRVDGEYLLDDSSKLGVSKCTIGWTDIDGEPYFLSGNWLVYGFHHVVTIQEGWFTNIYLTRLEHDAVARKV